MEGKLSLKLEDEARKSACGWVKKSAANFHRKMIFIIFFFFYLIFMSFQNIKIFFSFIILFLCWFFWAIIKIYLEDPPWWRSKRRKNAQLGCMITRKGSERKRENCC